ncbi:MAG TPA: dihydrodipicolinate synthase family protein [Ilumatobacter sp.]|nr:dihydrodipicolinate synthase family protein [Ilumatobacter sp.]
MRSPTTFVISLTPFTESGELDERGFRSHLRRLGRSGIGVYVAGSGSGEGYTLTRHDRYRVMTIAQEVLGGVAPVRVMGVEPRTTTEAIELGTDTAEVGLDAMQLYSLDMGHGYQPRPEELTTYLHAVLSTVTCPVVISTHQSVGYLYPVEVLATMVDTYDHIIGLNITTPDIPYLASAIDAVDGRVDIHVGGPMHAMTALALGATGYLSSEGNIAPNLCTSVVDAYANGDRATTNQRFAELIRLFRATQAAGGIIATKAALRSFGAAGGWPRQPRLDNVSPNVALLVDLIRRTGLAESEGLGEAWD